MSVKETPQFPDKLAEKLQTAASGIEQQTQHAAIFRNIRRRLYRSAH